MATHFQDITEAIMRGNWAGIYLKQLSFTPEAVHRIMLDKDANEGLSEIRALAKGKLGVFSPSFRVLVLFMERAEDAVLLKMFLS